MKGVVIALFAVMLLFAPVYADQLDADKALEQYVAARNYIEAQSYFDESLYGANIAYGIYYDMYDPLECEPPTREAKDGVVVWNIADGNYFLRAWKDEDIIAYELYETVAVPKRSEYEIDYYIAAALLDAMGLYYEHIYHTIEELQQNEMVYSDTCMISSVDTGAFGAGRWIRCRLEMLPDGTYIHACSITKN